MNEWIIIITMIVAALIAQKGGFGDALLEIVRETAGTELGVDLKRIEIRDVMLGGELKTVYASALTAKKEAQFRIQNRAGVKPIQLIS